MIHPNQQPHVFYNQTHLSISAFPPTFMHHPLIDFVTLWNIIPSLPSPLSSHSVHGPDHWRRVERNAPIFASQSGAIVPVIRLFALFHDSRRQNDNYDPEHGARGAALATSFRGKLFDLPDGHFDLLLYACVNHTIGRHHEDLTIATCWDADRLDLGRVGIIPDPTYFGFQ